MYGLKILLLNNMEFVILPSTRKNKKYMAVGKDYTVHFGDSRYEDYTTHKDPERQDRYVRRHAKTEMWDDPSTAGFWSRWLLWEVPDIRKAVDNMNRIFNFKVKFGR